MARYTAKRRQEIIREFAVRHNGHWNPALFVEEVQKRGEEHPAYDWFEWKQDKAAHEHRLWQAREFASGLRISFTVETVGRDGALTVKEVAAPAAISPVSSRQRGGGYVLTDPENGEHMAELCRQGAASLASWLERYSGAVEYAGGSVASVQSALAALTAAGKKKDA